MNTDICWNAINDRLEAVRNEAAIHRQLTQAARNNLWARLLPPLKRLEGWLERHAGREEQRQTVASR